MTNSEERRFRMETILGDMPERPIEKEEVVARIMFKWGFSRRTTLEYVKTLIIATKIKEDAGRIWRK